LLFGRLCRSIRGTVAILLLLGMVLLVVSLGLGVLTALIWEAPESSTAPQVLLLLDPHLSNADVDALFLEVRQWPEAAGLVFARDVSHLKLPTTVAAPPGVRAMLMQLDDDVSMQALLETLRTQDGIQQAIPLQTASSPNWLRQTQPLKPILLTAFVVLLLASFFALRGGVRRLMDKWRGEFEILRLAGVPRKNMLSSFAVIGVACGAIASLLATGALYFVMLWAQNHRDWVVQYLPTMLDQEHLIGLILVALIVGLFIGVVSGAWGARLRNT